MEERTYPPVSIVIFDTDELEGAMWGYMIYAVPADKYYPGMPEEEAQIWSLGLPQALAVPDVEP